jgi:hypothetical protein
LQRDRKRQHEQQQRLDLENSAHVANGTGDLAGSRACSGHVAPACARDACQCALCSSSHVVVMSARRALTVVERGKGVSGGFGDGLGLDCVCVIGDGAGGEEVEERRQISLCFFFFFFFFFFLKKKFFGKVEWLGALLDDGDALQMSKVRLEFLDAQGGVVKAAQVGANETKVRGIVALVLTADLSCTF